MNRREPLQKNQTIHLQIEDLGASGEGIGKYDGYPLFVKDALPGDVIEAIVTKTGKSYGFAHLKTIIRPSKDRVEPRCPLARTCGGCQIQALSYEKQLAYKEEKVRRNLRRIGGVPEEVLQAAKEPIIGMEDPWNYRNKEQFPVGTDKEGLPCAGFYAGRSHRLIPLSDCAIGLPENKEIRRLVINYMIRNNVRPYDEKTGQGIMRHIVTRHGLHTGEWMVTLVVNTKDEADLPKLSMLLVELIKIPGMTSICLSSNTKLTNVIMGDECRVLWGKDHIEDSIGGLTFTVSPLSFYQVNPVQTEKLYQTALDFAALTGTEQVWDLYCGIGTMSLFLAQKAGFVKGIEVVNRAVLDARKNALLNGISNVQFFEGRAEDLLPMYVKNTGEKADVVVMDPPRKGCDERLLRAVLQVSPSRIVYVSCDSATLARDIKFLRAGGYELTKYRPCDMFPHTSHVETVTILSRS